MEQLIPTIILGVYLLISTALHRAYQLSPNDPLDDFAYPRDHRPNW